MNALIILAQAVVAAGALAAVVLPLLSAKEAGELAPGDTDSTQAERESLLAEKALTYEAIKELELDKAGGKFSEADYQSMRKELEAEAIKVLQRLDALGHEEEEEEAASPAAPPACPSCGANIDPSHSYCPSCGAKTAG